MAEGAPLSFIADTFKVETCMGDSGCLKDLSTWELLNLRVHTVLEIPGRLTEEYGITSTYLDGVMHDYIIQSVSKDDLERRWKIEKTPQLFVAATNHYSWPKGAGA